MKKLLTIISIICFYGPTFGQQTPTYRPCIFTTDINDWDLLGSPQAVDIIGIVDFDSSGIDFTTTHAALFEAMLRQDSTDTDTTFVALWWEELSPGIVRVTGAMNQIDYGTSGSFEMGIRILPYNISTNTNEIPFISNFIPINLIVTGINQNNEDSFKIYPNPATNLVTIQDSREATATITNMLGQVVRTIPTNQPVDISDLRKGMYIINRNQKLLLIE